MNVAYAPKVPRRQTDNLSNREALVGDAARKEAEKYARCLIFPYDNPTYIPDGQLVRSSLFRSKRTFNVSVPVKESAGDGRGRFAFFVQPKIGDVGSTTQFQVGLLNMENGIPQTLYAKPSLVSKDSLSGSLALDPNATVLTQPRPACFAITASDLPATSPPLKGAVEYEPNAGTPFTFNSTWSVIDAGSGAPVTWIRPNTAGSFLFVVTIEVETAAAAQVLTFAIGRANSEDPDVGSLTMLKQIGLNSTKFMYIMSLALTPGDMIQMTRAVPAAGKTVETVAFLTPLFSPNYNLTENFGLIETLRPVGMSVLTTCVLSNMLASGNISAMVTQASQADKIFPSPKQWCTHEAMTTFSEYFTGPLAKGSYVWWKPSVARDRMFMSVEDANKYEYPTVLVAGTVGAEALNGGGDTLIPVQVTVEFVYEACQDSQLFKQRNYTGRQDIVDTAIQSVGRLVNMTENPKHSTLMRDIAKVMEAGSKFLPLLSLL